MKIVTPKEMARIESLAYEEGCSESDFMEAAGRGIATHVETYVEDNGLDKEVWLLCGQGNNGGDAYVAGRYLLSAGYRVVAIQSRPIPECRPLCRDTHLRFLQAKGTVIPFDPAIPIEFPRRSVILDGLFGTGFYGTVREPYASLIRSANASGCPIIAVDIPSGLDGESGMVEGPIICATETIYLGLPKTGFFLVEGWNNVGTLRGVDFGLPERMVEQAQSTLWLPHFDQLYSLLPPIRRDRHKYQTGLVVGLAGSPGMPGAAILSIFAALRGGAGIVRLLHPEGMQAELAACPPEVIRVAYSVQNISGVVDALNAAAACYVGPGMGRSAMAQVLLELVLPQLETPCVIDADALYLLSQNEMDLPKNTILTPHRGEMARLLHRTGYPELTQEFLQRCQEYVEKKRVTLVLKGGPTFVLHPGAPIFVNVFGDPGMATAGSGDVLTGLLAALMAQGMSAHAAALLGVALHGRAGESAARRFTSRGLIASDIIEHLSFALGGSNGGSRHQSSFLS